MEKEATLLVINPAQNRVFSVFLYVFMFVPLNEGSIELREMDVMIWQKMGSCAASGFMSPLKLMCKPNLFCSFFHSALFVRYVKPQLRQKQQLSFSALHRCVSEVHLLFTREE